MAKASSNDPTPGKANSPSATRMKRPEYTMNRAELIYPGDGHPFAAKPPLSGGDDPTPAHPAQPPTEQPRNKVHLMPVNAQEVMDLCTQCIATCDQRMEEAKQKGGTVEPDLTILLARNCAGICALLKQFLADHQVPEVGSLAVELASVCARVCDSCAIECSRRPESKACTELVRTCRSCAAECRKMAAG